MQQRVTFTMSSGPSAARVRRVAGAGRSVLALGVFAALATGCANDETTYPDSSGTAASATLPPAAQATQPPLATVSGPAPSTPAAPNFEAPNPGEQGSVPPTSGAGVDPVLLLDPAVADTATLARAVKARVEALTTSALVEVNAAQLAGTFDEDQLECVEPGYPVRAWFCGNDGGGRPWPVAEDLVHSFDFFAAEACDVAIASDLDTDACLLRSAEASFGEGGAASYRYRVVDGRFEVEMTVTADAADIDVPAGVITEGVCELVVAESGSGVAFEDEAVCERVLRDTF